jgi:hypothetical protein
MLRAAPYRMVACPLIKRYWTCSTSRCRKKLAIMGCAGVDQEGTELPAPA